MRFTKMEGLGNDFVILDQTVSVTPDLVRLLCDRHRGVGADGVLQVGNGGPPIEMGYWNADGSRAEMCGNGLRCVARYALDEGLVTDREFSVITPVGPRRVVAAEEPRVEIGPVTVEGTFDHDGLVFYRARVGNPHAVTLIANPRDAPVLTLGPLIESSVAGGTNVEFVTVVDRNDLAMRVWERGVGETLACGSGMVAAAAVALHLGLADETVSILVPGGTGLVELDEMTSWLTGPVRVVFRGDI